MVQLSTQLVGARRIEDVARLFHWVWGGGGVSRPTWSIVKPKIEFNFPLQFLKFRCIA